MDDQRRRRRRFIDRAPVDDDFSRVGIDHGAVHPQLLDIGRPVPQQIFSVYRCGGRLDFHRDLFIDIDLPTMPSASTNCSRYSSLDTAEPKVL